MSSEVSQNIPQMELSLSCSIPEIHLYEIKENKSKNEVNNTEINTNVEEDIFFGIRSCSSNEMNDNNSSSESESDSFTYIYNEFFTNLHNKQEHDYIKGGTNYNQQSYFKELREKTSSKHFEYEQQQHKSMSNNDDVKNEGNVLEHLLTVSLHKDGSEMQKGTEQNVPTMTAINTYSSQNIEDRKVPLETLCQDKTFAEAYYTQVNTHDSTKEEEEEKENFTRLSSFISDNTVVKAMHKSYLGSNETVHDTKFKIANEAIVNNGCDKAETVNTTSFVDNSVDLKLKKHNSSLPITSKLKADEPIERANFFVERARLLNMLDYTSMLMLPNTSNNSSMVEETETSRGLRENESQASHKKEVQEPSRYHMSSPPPSTSLYAVSNTYEKNVQSHTARLPNKGKNDNDDDDYYNNNYSINNNKSYGNLASGKRNNTDVLFENTFERNDLCNHNNTKQQNTNKLLSKRNVLIDKATDLECSESNMLRRCTSFYVPPNMECSETRKELNTSDDNIESCYYDSDHNRLPVDVKAVFSSTEVCKVSSDNQRKITTFVSKARTREGVMRVVKGNFSNDVSLDSKTLLPTLLATESLSKEENISLTPSFSSLSSSSSSSSSSQARSTAESSTPYSMLINEMEFPLIMLEKNSTAKFNHLDVHGKCSSHNANDSKGGKSARNRNLALGVSEKNERVERSLSIPSSLESNMSVNQENETSIMFHITNDAKKSNSNRKNMNNSHNNISKSKQKRSKKYNNNNNNTMEQRADTGIVWRLLSFRKQDDGPMCENDDSRSKVQAAAKTPCDKRNNAVNKTQENGRKTKTKKKTCNKEKKKTINNSSEKEENNNNNNNNNDNNDKNKKEKKYKKALTKKKSDRKSKKQDERSNEKNNYEEEKSYGKNSKMKSKGLYCKTFNMQSAEAVNVTKEQLHEGKSVVAIMNSNDDMCEIHNNNNINNNVMSKRKENVKHYLAKPVAVEEFVDVEYDKEKEKEHAWYEKEYDDEIHSFNLDESLLQNVNWSSNDHLGHLLELSLVNSTKKKDEEELVKTAIEHKSNVLKVNVNGKVRMLEEERLVKPATVTFTDEHLPNVSKLNLIKENGIYHNTCKGKKLRREEEQQESYIWHGKEVCLRKSEKEDTAEADKQENNYINDLDRKKFNWKLHDCESRTINNTSCTDSLPNDMRNDNNENSHSQLPLLYTLRENLPENLELPLLTNSYNARKQKKLVNVPKHNMIDENKLSTIITCGKQIKNGKCSTAMQNTHTEETCFSAYEGVTTREQLVTSVTQRRHTNRPTKSAEEVHNMLHLLSDTSSKPERLNSARIINRKPSSVTFISKE